MKDYLSIIRQPVVADMQRFDDLFNEALTHADGTLSLALDFIRQRSGKRMRPLLTMLLARVFGSVSDVTQYAALGLELLHTASLVHDDVVDEAAKRRGQRSVNAVYDNKVAVLVGDYILSAALLNVCETNNVAIVKVLSNLGKTLSNGEILQLTTNGSDEISEDAYYNVILQKTAGLFEACGELGAMSVNASEEQVLLAKSFGKMIGMIFQIRDDIFDYFDSTKIGKPTGNDMLEGKLTLPAIHALLKMNDPQMNLLAQKVKDRSAKQEDIDQLVDFTKRNGGIEYAQKRMQEMSEEAALFIETHVADPEIKASLTAYLEYVVQRDK